MLRPAIYRYTTEPDRYRKTHLAHLEWNITDKTDTSVIAGLFKTYSSIKIGKMPSKVEPRLLNRDKPG
jgi:hypothetical protein